MQTLMKVVITFFIIMIGGAILAGIKDARGGGGHGPFGIIIALALFAGIRAVWKYGKEDKEKQNGNGSKVEKTDLNKD